MSFRRFMISSRVYRCLASVILIFQMSLGSNVLRAAQAQTVIPLVPTPSAQISFQPPIIVGLNIDPENPWKFDFIIDSGYPNVKGSAFENESTRLIKYFLASLTIPENQMWVNLSPYEKNRIIPGAFGQTLMGRDLLEQDYQLKQLTARLLNPENSTGEKFWDRIYAQARDRFGTTDIPFSTFNKVWIVPAKASIYEHEKGAVIVDARLKVMMEEDYLSLEANQNSTAHGLGNISPDQMRQLSEITMAIYREIIIPEIEREVNEGETFANLRQIYHAMLLASWYKRALKESLLSQRYVNQEKVVGVETGDSEAIEGIYDRYVKAFTQGATGLIREEYDPIEQKLVPRKYFSGGINFTEKKSDKDFAILGRNSSKNLFSQHGTIFQIRHHLIKPEEPDRRYNMGTGFLMGQDNDYFYIATNEHVVAERINVSDKIYDSSGIEVAVYADFNSAENLLESKPIPIGDVESSFESLDYDFTVLKVRRRGKAKEYLFKPFKLDFRKLTQEFINTQAQIVGLFQGKYPNRLSVVTTSFKYAEPNSISKGTEFWRGFSGSPLVKDDGSAIGIIFQGLFTHERTALLTYNEILKSIQFIPIFILFEILTKNPYMKIPGMNFIAPDAAMIGATHFPDSEDQLASRGEVRNKSLTPGGIDLNPAITAMEIEKEGSGFIAPRFEIPEQSDAAMLNFEGLTPVILNVSSVNRISDIVSSPFAP